VRDAISNASRISSMGNMNYMGQKVKLDREQKRALKEHLKGGAAMTFRDMTAFLQIDHNTKNICKLAQYINYLFSRDKVKLKALPKRAKREGLQPDMKWYTVWTKSKD
jgi:hypothetical protein